MSTLPTCEAALTIAKQLGAQEAMATVASSHDVDVEVREGKIEKLAESQSAQLSVALYVDGRYATHTTNALDEASLKRFLTRAVGATRLLDVDADRKLPAPELYAGRVAELPGLLDRTRGGLTVAERKERALAIEAEGRAAGGADVVSATASVSDSLFTVAKMTSNGFRDEETASSFSHSAGVTLKEGDKRPDDWHWCTVHTRGEMLANIGKEAGERARSRLGQKKIQGGEAMILIENRAAARLFSMFFAAASGYALWQKRSFLDAKLDKAVMAPLMTLVDEPLLPGAAGSRRFDGEGLTMRRRPIVDGGVLRAFNLDSYYARKLKLAPTSGGFSNVVLTPGKRSRAELEASGKRLFVINRFNGGNSNSLTGDFSLGVAGYLVENGKRTQPITEMNLTGNHLTFWTRVVELGNDPWIYSSWRLPSIVVDKAALSGA